MKRKRKQCTTKGCKKFRLPDQDLCRDCFAEAKAKKPNGQTGKGNGVAKPSEVQTDPLDEIMRLSSLELLEFRALHAETVSAKQEVQLLDFDQQTDDHEYVERKRRRSQQKMGLLSAQQNKEKEYLHFVEKLAAKFNLDPKKMAIDDATGIIRELA